jgi:hypothetical protein
VKKGGKYVPARVKGHLSSSEKSAKKRENKKFRSSPTGRKLARKLKTQKAKKMAAAMRQARKSAHESVSPTDRINTLLAETKTLMEAAEATEIPSFDSADAIKGFAQISLVAGKLAEEFESIAEESESPEYLDLAEMFDALADEAAESADSMVEISESEEFEPNEEVVESDFAEMTCLPARRFGDLRRTDRGRGRGRGSGTESDSDDSEGRRLRRGREGRRQGSRRRTGRRGRQGRLAKNDEECADGMGMPKVEPKPEPAKPTMLRPEEGGGQGKGKRQVTQTTEAERFRRTSYRAAVAK